MIESLHQQSEALSRAREDIAMHKAEIAAMQSALDDLKGVVAELVKTVNGMRDQLTEAKGGWRVLMLLGGASATFGGLIVWAIEHLTGKTP